MLSLLMLRSQWLVLQDQREMSLLFLSTQRIVMYLSKEGWRIPCRWDRRPCGWCLRNKWWGTRAQRGKCWQHWRSAGRRNIWEWQWRLTRRLLPSTSHSAAILASSTFSPKYSLSFITTSFFIRVIITTFHLKQLVQNLTITVLYLSDLMIINL